MSKIIEYSIGHCVKDTSRGYMLYLHIAGGKKQRETGSAPYITYITLKELLEMTDFDKEYILESGFKFTPKYYTFISNRDPKDPGVPFEEVISRVLRFAYFNNAITMEEYTLFMFRHYDYYYLRYYHNENRRDLDIYNYYVSNMIDISRVKDKLTTSQFATADSIDALHPTENSLPVPIDFQEFSKIMEVSREIMEYNNASGSYKIKIPGKFMGCWVDDQDRVRPRTSRVSYKTDYYAILKMVFLLGNCPREKVTGI